MSILIAIYIKAEYWLCDCVPHVIGSPGIRCLFNQQNRTAPCDIRDGFLVTGRNGVLLYILQPTGLPLAFWLLQKEQRHGFSHLVKNQPPGHPSMPRIEEISLCQPVICRKKKERKSEALSCPWYAKCRTKYNLALTI